MLWGLMEIDTDVALGIQKQQREQWFISHILRSNPPAWRFDQSISQQLESFVSLATLAWCNQEMRVNDSTQNCTQSNIFFQRLAACEMIMGINKWCCRNLIQIGFETKIYCTYCIYINRKTWNKPQNVVMQSKSRDASNNANTWSTTRDHIHDITYYRRTETTNPMQWLLDSRWFIKKNKSGLNTIAIPSHLVAIS